MTVIIMIINKNDKQQQQPKQTILQHTRIILQQNKHQLTKNNTYKQQ